jgi:two-component system NarL family sensor kinase
MPTYRAVDLSSIAALPAPGEFYGIDSSAVDQLSTLIWQVSALSLLVVVAIIGASLIARRSGFSAFAGTSKIALTDPLFRNIHLTPEQFLPLAKPRAIDLAEARALLHATLESLDSHVAILDEAGNLIDGNEAWLKSSVMLLWPALHNQQRAAYEVDGNRRDFIFDSFAHLVRSARHRFKANYHREVDDRRRVFEFSATRIRTHGAPHILVVHEDVTERKEANTRIKELSRRAADIQQDERQRIAREIHDSTSQHLIAISLNLINLRRERAVSGKMSKLLEDIEKSTSDAQQEIRLFSYLLYPSQLERSGVRPTIEHYVKGFSDRAGIEPHVELCEEMDDLNIDVQQSLLRIVQEALVNVHRHAAATNVSVRVRAHGDGLLMTIADNGIGMPARPADASAEDENLGVGIPGMRARVQECGGTFRIDSSRFGTKLVVTIPRDDAEWGGTASARSAAR